MMNKPSEKIVRYTLEKNKKIKSKMDYERLDNMSDDDIDYSDIPETDSAFWAEAKLHDPGAKKIISIRIDPDVLEWFKQQKGRYQTLMDTVLQHYMNTHKS